MGIFFSGWRFIPRKKTKVNLPSEIRQRTGPATDIQHSIARAELCALKNLVVGHLHMMSRVSACATRFAPGSPFQYLICSSFDMLFSDNHFAIGGNNFTFSCTIRQDATKSVTMRSSIFRSPSYSPKFRML